MTTPDEVDDDDDRPCKCFARAMARAEQGGVQHCLDIIQDTAGLGAPEEGLCDTEMVMRMLMAITAMAVSRCASDNLGKSLVSIDVLARLTKAQLREAHRAAAAETMSAGHA